MAIALALRGSGLACGHPDAVGKTGLLAKVICVVLATCRPAERPPGSSMMTSAASCQAEITHELQGEAPATACSPGSPLRVPAGSATRTAAWSVYENVILAPLPPGGRTDTLGEAPLTAKGLAAKAFRNSKDWTPEAAPHPRTSSRSASTRPFAGRQRDTDQGAARSASGQVAADAAIALSRLDRRARPAPPRGGSNQLHGTRVLLVENSDRFAQAREGREITGEWLVDLGKGLHKPGRPGAA